MRPGRLKRTFLGFALCATLLLAAGCTKKRWTCTACVDRAGAPCAVTSKLDPSPARTEEEAKCGAGEQLCATLSGEDLRRFCANKAGSRMTGCSAEFTNQFKFTCTTATEIDAPLPGVR